MNASDLKRAARHEMARRLLRSQESGRGAFSLEEFCGNHKPQLAAARDRAQWQTWLCARQSGKTTGCDGVELDNGLFASNSTNLFLGLKATGVRTSNWEPLWRRICDRYRIPGDWHNETRMLTRFPNGARVMFSGTDDLENIKKYLGNRIENGVVVIDEAQDQKDQVLRYLVYQLLPPMLGKTARVILAGVLPDVEAGLFLELSNAPGWSHHEWGRAANVHTPEAMEQLQKHIETHGLTMDDPQIQRDWFMRRVWDPGATAYRYKRETAGYSGDPPDWLDSFSVGIDPGAHDRTAVQVWGWGSRDRNVYHVHEWVTARDANTTWAQIAEQLKIINDRWRPLAWYYDAGGSQMTLDLFARDYGIPVVKAANKNDLAGQVARMADLLALGRAKVRIGSELENDLMRARWDADARAKGLYRWSSAWHPDAADAARYGLFAYFESYREDIPPERQKYLEGIARAERNRRSTNATDRTYDPEEFAEDLTSDLYD